MTERLPHALGTLGIHLVVRLANEVHCGNAHQPTVHHFLLLTVSDDLDLNADIRRIEAGVADCEFEIGRDVSLFLERRQEQAQARSLGETEDSVKRTVILIALQHVIDCRIEFGITVIRRLHPPRLSHFSMHETHYMNMLCSQLLLEALHAVDRNRTIEIVCTVSAIHMEYRSRLSI